MNRNARLLMLIASLLLVVPYFVPIWEITLEAPQYPEGLGLEIWIDTIDGLNPRDLDKVNNLNHYIGMKEIIPESIPELKIMPFLVGFMLIFGLLTAYFARPYLLYSWTVLFIIIAIVGLVDFYLWEYDYGHNLDPTAAIKIPGMSYQPPLIGSKKLLNFWAVSLPDIGGYCIFTAILLGVIASYITFKSAKNKTRISNNETAQNVDPGTTARRNSTTDKLHASAGAHTIRS